jgi:hypothetical protein
MTDQHTLAVTAIVATLKWLNRTPVSRDLYTPMAYISYAYENYGR